MVDSVYVTDLPFVLGYYPIPTVLSITLESENTYSNDSGPVTDDVSQDRRLTFGGDEDPCHENLSITVSYSTGLQ